MSADGYAPCLLHEVTNCSICSGKDKQLAKEESIDFGWPARHPGVCPECGQTFDVGTVISYGARGWGHTECPE